MLSRLKSHVFSEIIIQEEGMKERKEEEMDSLRDVLAESGIIEEHRKELIEQLSGEREVLLDSATIVLDRVVCDPSAEDIRLSDSSEKTLRDAISDISIAESSVEFIPVTRAEWSPRTAGEPEYPEGETVIGYEATGTLHVEAEISCA